MPSRPADPMFDTPAVRRTSFGLASLSPGSSAAETRAGTSDNNALDSLGISSLASSDTVDSIDSLKQQLRQAKAMLNAQGVDIDSERKDAMMKVMKTTQFKQVCI